jgi:hypothetical protein
VLCPDAEEMARALLGRGLRVHRGPMVSADHVVRGRERSELHATGAIAVDMECAATIRAADRPSGERRPVAVARVVVDTPDSELLRPATITNGLRAYRALRRAVPAFTDWQRAVGAAAARPDDSDTADSGSDDSNHITRG